MPSASTIARHAAWKRRRRGRAWGPGFASEPLPVTFPSSPLITRAYIALGADLTASHLTWNWLDITGYVRHDLGISVVFGRRDESTRVTTSRCQLKIENQDGRFSRRNPMGPYFGLLSRNTPIWIQLDPGSGFVDQYHGYVNEWPTRWSDQSGSDTYVVIQCAGVMRRLAQGENLKSPMFRSISGVAANDYVPHAYWPMEDGSNATQIASGLSGGSPLTLPTGISLAANSTLTGSDPLPSFAAGSTLTAVVPTYTATGKFVVQFSLRVPTQPGGDINLLEATVSGSAAVKYRLLLQPGSSLIRFEAYDSAGTLISSGADVFDPATFYGRWFTFALAVRPYAVTPTDVHYTVHFFDALGTSTGPIGNILFTSTTPGVVTDVRLFADVAVNHGHLAVFTDANFNTTTDVSATAPAMYGHDGELAHVRMARLCREEGITLTTQAPTSAAMGPQSTGTLLTVLRECETADQGVLYEHEYGLGYQALSERYNQPVTLELDFDQRHIRGIPEPADDDQRIRNQWKIGRPGGSSATVRDQDSVDADGLYDDGDNAVILETDAQLAPHAGWRVRLGTVDEDRWPRLPLKLHGSPALIPGWLGTPFGSRVTIANPPSQMAPDTIDAIIEGYSEHWDTKQWNVSLNTSPASPYQVGVAGNSSTAGSWAQTVDAVAAEDVDTTETSIDVTSTDTWTTTPAGERIVLGGEVVTLDAVAGSAPNWTFTVTRSVNGVVKSHTAGAPVRVYRPAVAIY